MNFIKKKMKKDLINSFKGLGFDLDELPGMISRIYTSLSAEIHAPTHRESTGR
jgi:hypothetical protein